MTLRENLQDQLKQALKARDAVRSATLRLILAALKDRDITARESGNFDGIDENGILQLLESMVKQRRESITMFEQGGRMDMADLERQEIAVIQSFLPVPLSDAEREQAIRGAIRDTGAASLRDMGKVMAHLREKYMGRIDFSVASTETRALLAGA